jgi:hypothetical protein
MHIVIRRALETALVTGGLLVAGAAAANAGEADSTDILDHTTVAAPIQAPITLDGTAVGALGDATSIRDGAPEAGAPAPGSGTGTPSVPDSPAPIVPTTPSEQASPGASAAPRGSGVTADTGNTDVQNVGLGGLGEGVTSAGEPAVAVAAVRGSLTDGVRSGSDLLSASPLEPLTLGQPAVLGASDPAVTGRLAATGTEPWPLAALGALLILAGGGAFLLQQPAIAR